jgi:hypothetical protein
MWSGVRSALSQRFAATFPAELTSAASTAASISRIICLECNLNALATSTTAAHKDGSMGCSQSQRFPYHENAIFIQVSPSPTHTTEVIDSLFCLCTASRWMNANHLRTGEPELFACLAVQPKRSKRTIRHKIDCSTSVYLSAACINQFN